MQNPQIAPLRATKKPVEIEYWQWSGRTGDLHRILAWIRDNGQAAYIEDTYASQGPDLLKIVTLEGEMTVTQGDYVIKGVQGEFYPCKPDIFEATYDKENTDA